MLKYIWYIKTNYYVSNIKIKIFLKLIILEKIINKLLFFYEDYQAASIDALKMYDLYLIFHTSNYRNNNIRMYPEIKYQFYIKYFSL